MSTNAPGNSDKVVVMLPFEINLDQTVSLLLLQSLDPLIKQITQVIRPLIAHHIITTRHRLLSGEELVTVRRAAMLTNITPSTIYDWIKKKKIIHYQIGNNRIVSVSQIRQVIRHSSQADRRHKKSGRVQKKSKQVVSSDIGLPPFPGHLRSE